VKTVELHSLFPPTDAHHCVWNALESCLYLFSHPKLDKTGGSKTLALI